MASQCASVNPLALFSKPHSPAEGLAAQQRPRAAAEGEAAQELAEEARGKGKG